MAVKDIYNEIQSHLDTANEGDVFLVHNNTYKEALYIDQDNIRLIAIEPLVILNGEGEEDNGIIIDAEGVLIEGFTIINYKKNGIWIKGDKNRIINNKIIQCDENGILINDCGNSKKVEKENKNNFLIDSEKETDSLRHCYLYCNLIYKNVIERCSNDGILVRYAKCTSIICNKMTDCYDGIDLEAYSIGSIIIRNEMNCCRDDGIDNESSYSYISDNKVCSNMEQGIDVSRCCSIIEHNIVSENQYDGIKVNNGAYKNFIFENDVNNNIEYDLVKESTLESNVFLNNNCCKSDSPNLCNDGCSQCLDCHNECSRCCKNKNCRQYSIWDY